MWKNNIYYLSKVFLKSQFKNKLQNLYVSKMCYIIFLCTGGLTKIQNSFTHSFKSFFNFNDNMKLLHCLKMFMNISYLLNLLKFYSIIFIMH